MNLTMIFQAFMLKLVDNVLSTLKTIFIQKEKYILGALSNAFSTLFYLIAIVQVAKSNDIFSIIAMCVATFLGTLIPGILVKKSERDRLYIYEITTSNLEEGKMFADEVRDTNIAIRSYSSYDEDMNKVLICKVYCSTKEESRILDTLIPNSFRYHIYVPVANN